jgi:hypothetical protein
MSSQRDKGVAIYASSFEVQLASPLDTRLVAPKVNDLVNPDYWKSFDNNIYLYYGIAVSVWDDEVNNNGIYILTNKLGGNAPLFSYTTIGNWIKVSGSESSVSDNISVSATQSDNTNSYIGISDPIISTYSTNDIYLVTFDKTNSLSATVSLDINSLGVYDIIKFNEDGPFTLTDGEEITPNRIYYLLWDGDNFQLYDSNPSSSPITYTNLNPVPTTIGGIAAGMTFSNSTMKEMWDMLLYPYQVPNFTSFTFNFTGGNPREVGNPINSSSYNFTWNTTFGANIKPNTINIKDVTNNQNLLSNGANDGLESISIGEINKTIPGTHQWSISATRTNNTNMSSTLTVTWLWRRYFGTSILTELDENNIESLSDNNLSSSGAGAYNFVTGGYKYFSWPVTFTAPSLFRDFSTNLAVAMAGVGEEYNIPVGGYFAKQVSVTNQYGQSIDYYVFRTLNILGGSITIVVT